MAPIVCVPSIWPIAFGEGLAPGIGIFIFESGEGEAAGIGIPGVCRWVCVPDGDGAGLGAATGVGLAAGFGIWWP
jgi:hypothetical protein